ncbi:DUF2065 domain-containing protein [Kiloniella laminariae]|uniref:DUF2065 domain-containing protein n=1 Tax=Kiloniella laminariae TaxID=454162 RepID=A0ABT4LI40_9PROT|nr:DUF2065 domain-containing protein [Kiloniella laminariae]MCZ4280757.1 DUF2065 domain-containing protein [Kiloniella laminariae]
MNNPVPGYLMYRVYMIDFLIALALVFVIEGIFLALFPHRVRQILSLLDEMPPENLRKGGLVCAAIGVMLVWLLKTI